MGALSGAATNATTAGTVTTAAQPNITSVGTLSDLTVTANTATGGIKTDNYYYANGVSISFAGAYSNSNVSAFLAVFGSNTISTTGNITGGNIITTNYVIRSVSTSISAAGTVQANATALTKEINVVSTVASGSGVRLPTAVAGMVISITNTNANSLLVYPATSGIINSLAANAAFTQPAGATLQFIAPTTTQWYTVGATYA